MACSPPWTPTTRPCSPTLGTHGLAAVDDRDGDPGRRCPFHRLHAPGRCRRGRHGGTVLPLPDDAALARSAGRPRERRRRCNQSQSARGEAVTAILGISAFYHDSAAALIVDGTIVAAAQEERFTRKQARSTLSRERRRRSASSRPDSPPSRLDYVGFYDKPFLKFERLLETYLAYAPRRVPLVSVWRCRCGCSRSCTCRASSSRGLDGRYHRRFVFTGAPRVARRERILSVAVRGSGDPDARRRRRVGDHQLRLSARATKSR